MRTRAETRARLPSPSGAHAFDVSATDQSVANGGGGSDFASFLVGMAERPGSEGNDAPNFTKDLFVAEASPYYAAFIQDTHRPTSKLTITAGIRWDIFGGKTERHNRLEYFNTTVANTYEGVSYTGAEIYVNGSNRSPFTTNMKDFGPRLGIAWQPVNRPCGWRRNRPPQIPAYHAYPNSGSTDPSPLPNFFMESVTVMWWMNFRLL